MLAVQKEMPSAADCIKFWSADFKDDMSDKQELMKKMSLWCFKCSPPKVGLLGLRNLFQMLNLFFILKGKCHMKKKTFHPNSSGLIRLLNSPDIAPNTLHTLCTVLGTTPGRFWSLCSVEWA